MPEDKKLTQFLKKHSKQQHLSSTESARALLKRIQRKHREVRVPPEKAVKGKGKTDLLSG